MPRTLDPMDNRQPIYETSDPYYSTNIFGPCSVKYAGYYDDPYLRLGRSIRIPLGDDLIRGLAEAVSRHAQDV